ncbi:MAG: hypothetical protein ACLTL8_02575 [Bifidobacterium pseudocatenulatum]
MPGTQRARKAVIPTEMLARDGNTWHLFLPADHHVRFSTAPTDTRDVSARTIWPTGSDAGAASRAVDDGQASVRQAWRHARPTALLPGAGQKPRRAPGRG